VNSASTLAEADLARLAELHVASIDDSLPALLGERFTRGLYRFFSASELELLLVERVEGRIEGACVVSLAPATLNRRIARATFGSLLPAAVRSVLTRSEFRALLWHTLRDSGEEEKVPEITYVFVASVLRGRNLGQRLVGQVDAALSERGVAGYYVKTLDDPANRAVQFYEQNGFRCIGLRKEGGRNFVEFHRQLSVR